MLSVVEDEPASRELIRMALEEVDLLVATAADGVQAIAALPPEGVDAVVLDRNLPGPNGVAVARALRRLHGTALPIVLMSASPVLPEVARQFGAAYIRKPFDVQSLIATVIRAAGERDLEPPGSASARLTAL